MADRSQVELECAASLVALQKHPVRYSTAQEWAKHVKKVKATVSDELQSARPNGEQDQSETSPRAIQFPPLAFVQSSPLEPPNPSDAELNNQWRKARYPSPSTTPSKPKHSATAMAAVRHHKPTSSWKGELDETSAASPSNSERQETTQNTPPRNPMSENQAASSSPLSSYDEFQCESSSN
ncbi:hypothetical protein LTR27_002256 [Elasticomyces elasticus]|nr:hypothetical protein LTR27_002256 [Elasticomyces elasticus]